MENTPLPQSLQGSMQSGFQFDPCATRAALGIIVHESARKHFWSLGATPFELFGSKPILAEIICAYLSGINIASLDLGHFHPDEVSQTLSDLDSLEVDAAWAMHCLDELARRSVAQLAPLTLRWAANRIEHEGGASVDVTAALLQLLDRMPQIDFRTENEIAADRQFRIAASRAHNRSFSSGRAS